MTDCLLDAKKVELVLVFDHLEELFVDVIDENQGIGSVSSIANILEECRFDFVGHLDLANEIDHGAHLHAVARIELTVQKVVLKAVSQDGRIEDRHDRFFTL